MTPFTSADVANTTPEQLTALRAGAPQTYAAWIQVAAEMGLIEAQAIYAQILLDGIGLERSRGAQGRSVAARVGLGQRKRGDDFAGGQEWQVALFLLGRAVDQDAL